MSTAYTRGYYIVLPSGERHFLGLDKHKARKALTQAINKYLTDGNSRDYWIDWCYGDTPSGEVGWSGVDQTDALHQGDMMMQFGRV